MSHETKFSIEVPGEALQVPPGVLPRVPTLPPFNALGWIAFRTASWTPIKEPGLKRDDQRSHLTRAHDALVEAALLGKVAVYGVRHYGGDVSPIAIFQEPVVIPPPVFSGAITINPVATLTLSYRQDFFQPDNTVKAETLQRICYLYIRFATVHLEKCWPGREVAAKATKVGQGRYKVSDALLISKMKQHIESGRAGSVWEAALLEASNAEGRNTQLESKAKRLHSAFQNFPG